MAINKKLIHFNTFENFNSKKLSANIENTKYTLGVDGEIQTGSPDILYQSIVYIKDTKQQWTHGQLYASVANVEAVDTSETLDDVETNTYVKYVAQSLTDEQKLQVKQNLGISETPDLSETYIYDISESAISNGIGSINGIKLWTSSDSGKNPTNFTFKTVNGESLLGEGNIVISGGSNSSGGAYALIEHDTNDTTFTLTPNTFHTWGEVGSLILTFGEEQSGVANEFLFQFESGETATTLTLPDNLIWANDDTPVIESNYTYQVSILKGLAAIMKFKKKTNLIENKLTVTNGGMDSTFTFEYPVTSDVSVTFTSNFGDTDIVTIYSGSMSGKTNSAPGYNSLTNNNIDYITPKKDSVYVYTF